VELLRQWKTRLRLDDWDITIEFSKHMDGLGECRMAAKYKQARIKMKDPEFIDPDGLTIRDPEVTLVHELLHVQAGQLTEFLGRSENERWHDEMERVVELTAIALVNLRRNGERPADTLKTEAEKAKGYQHETGPGTDWCQCGHMECEHAAMGTCPCSAPDCACPSYSYHHHLTKFKRGLRIGLALEHQGLAALVEFERYLNHVVLK
jgi:hypothetical protein